MLKYLLETQLWTVLFGIRLEKLEWLLIVQLYHGNGWQFHLKNPDAGTEHCIGLQMNIHYYWYMRIGSRHKLGTYNWTKSCALYYIGFMPFKYKRLLNLEMKFAVLDHELMITLKWEAFWNQQSLIFLKQLNLAEFITVVHNAPFWFNSFQTKQQTITKTF